MNQGHSSCCSDLEIRQPLNEVLDSMHIDGLLASEWSRLEELCKLLKPIQCHTDTLQSDTMVLCNVCHLSSIFAVIFRNQIIPESLHCHFLNPYANDSVQFMTPRT